MNQTNPVNCTTSSTPADEYSSESQHVIEHVKQTDYRSHVGPALPGGHICDHKRRRDTGKRRSGAQTRGDAILVEFLACPCASKRKGTMPSSLRRCPRPRRLGEGG